MACARLLCRTENAFRWDLRFIGSLLVLSLFAALAQSRLAAQQSPKTAAKQPAAAGGKGALLMQLDRITKFPYSEATIAYALPGGKVLIAGAAHASAKDVVGWDPFMGKYGCHVTFVMLRLNPNGAVDQSFGNNGFAVADLGKWGGYPSKILIQPDGKILLMGYTSSTWWPPAPTFPDRTYAISRFTADGQPDPSYGTNGILKHPAVPGFFFMTAALQPDGKLLLGGGVHTRGPDQFRLMRLNINGALDTTFNEKGLPADFSAEQIRGFAVAKNGAIWVVGQFDPKHPYQATNSRGIVAKLNPNGTPDPSFGYHGYILVKNSVQGEFSDCFMTPDDKFVMVGWWNSAFMAVKFLANGSLDSSYGKDGIASIKFPDRSLPLPLSSAMTPNGDIYVGYGTDKSFSVIHFKANGSPDLSIGKSGFLSSTDIGVVYASDISDHWMTPMPDGRIIVAGFHQYVVEEGNSSHKVTEAKIVTLRR